MRSVIDFILNERSYKKFSKNVNKVSMTPKPFNLISNLI